MRNKIKMFAQQKVTLPKGRHKIIILDEADRYIVFFSRPQQLCEMFPIYPAVLDSMRCFEQAIRNDLRGNKCVLNGTFTRFLILSCDRGFEGNAQYRDGALWGSAQCNLTIFQITGCFSLKRI